MLYYGNFLRLEALSVIYLDFPLDLTGFFREAISFYTTALSFLTPNIFAAMCKGDLKQTACLTLLVTTASAMFMK